MCYLAAIEVVSVASTVVLEPLIESHKVIQKSR